MAKILLVYDDKKLLSHTEMFLKKISFDVMGIAHELSLREQLLGFNPDVVIACGWGAKVNAVHIGKRIAEFGFYKGKVIIIINPQHKPSATEMRGVKMDTLLEFPIQDIRMIETVTKMLGLSTDNYIEKYSRIMHTEMSVNPSQMARYTPSKEEQKKREARNKKYLQDADFNPKATLKPQEAKKRWKELESNWDLKRLSEIDELKKAFVIALFTKKS